MLDGYRIQNSLSDLGLDPCDRLRMLYEQEQQTMTEKSPPTLNVDQQQKLLEALQKNDSPPITRRRGIRNYLIACLMLDAGLRVGEVVQLEFSHLFFNGEPVRSLLLTKNITKNKKQRSILVNTRLKKAIKDFFSDSLPWDNLYASYQVFRSPKTQKCLTTRQVENIINSAGMKSLGRPVNPHMLRHTFGSGLMRVTNMRTVQELLGHSHISSTQIYTHPNEDDKKKAIEDLENEVKLLGQDIEDLAGIS